MSVTQKKSLICYNPRFTNQVWLVPEKPMTDGSQDSGSIYTAAQTLLYLTSLVSLHWFKVISRTINREKVDPVQGLRSHRAELLKVECIMVYSFDWIVWTHFIISSIAIKIFLLNFDLGTRKYGAS